ncbi:MAG: ATP-binding protein [Oscillochloridaceae bacterium umkhey_bin13]
MRPPIAFPAWLKQARLEHSLTQAQLAAQAGISLSLVRKYEAGVRLPPRATALRLAVALRLPLDEHAAFVAAARLAPSAPPPPVPTPSACLPSAPTPLLGRDADLDRLCAQLQTPTVRLVTLLGPPGVGKSRLALAAATRLAPAFGDGSTFVELAPLNDAATLIPSLAAALGSPGVNTEAALLTLAATRRQLLVLDNCEHLPAVAPLVARLLAAAPQLVLLATSRTPLRLRAEQRFLLQPLALPSSLRLAKVAAAPASRLFCERASAIKPDFVLSTTNAPVIAALCQRLDGLPLAIELAAARSDQRDPAALLASLDAGIASVEADFIDLPAHQRTLQTTLAWSEQLLAPADQAAFARLGVFWGSFDATAAAAVDITAPQLATLHEANLIQTLENGRMRLLETLRAYARERLALQPEAPVYYTLYAAYYADLAEGFAPLLRTAEAPQAMDQLAVELPNLRAALQWSLQHDGGVIAARITTALHSFWLSRGAVYEGRLVEPLLAAEVGSTMPPALQARALLTTGYLASQQGALGAYRQIERGLALARYYGTPADVTLGLILAGMLTRFPGNLSICATILAEAVTLARTLDQPLLLAYALNQLGYSYACDGKYHEGVPALAEAVYLTETVGEQVMYYRYQCDLAEALRAKGELHVARQMLEQLLVALGPAGDQTATWEAQLRLAVINLEEGQFDAAAMCLASAERFVTQLGIGYGRAYLLYWQAHLALAQGAYDRAAAILPEAQRTAIRMHGPAELAVILALRAKVALTAGDQLQAARYCGASTGLVTRFGLRADRLSDPLRQTVYAALDPGAQNLADHVAQLISERIPQVSYPNAQLAHDSIRLDRVLAAALNREQ